MVAEGWIEVANVSVVRKWEGKVDVGKSKRWEGCRVRNKRWRASSAA